MIRDMAWFAGGAATLLVAALITAERPSPAAGCSQRGPEYVWINRTSECRIAPWEVPARQPVVPTRPPLPTVTPQPPRGAAPALPYALDLAPGQTARTLTVVQWQALQGAFPERTYTMARTGWCEGGLDPVKAVMDTDGTMSYGTFMVKPQFWGEVDPTLDAQARQAARIAARHPDLWPWAATRHGCDEWSR